ncbi:hypothetical protein QDF68_004137 [Klebsiella pneumoniae]|nr:hypothetical protein [Klebsiella pneumoniae]
MLENAGVISSPDAQLVAELLANRLLNVIGVRLENGKYPTLSLFFVQAVIPRAIKHTGNSAHIYWLCVIRPDIICLQV